MREPSLSIEPSVSYAADIAKLEQLITRNSSARHGLLHLQRRLLELDVCLQKPGLASIREATEPSQRKAAVRLPPIN